MASRRCSNCGISWPSARKFGECPVCEARTDFMGGGTPITPDEASKLVNEALFERFYEEHDVKREGPTPEEKGAADARKILEMERLLSQED